MRINLFRLKNIFLASAWLMVLFATFKAAIWRLDTHHDGYVYLPTFLAKFGHLPPEYPKTVYGIAQPVTENLIMYFIGSTFINYRTIALTIIFLTSFFIYKISKNFTNNTKYSLVMALLWLSANPTWANAKNSKLIAIQESWPNLWIQFATLLALLILQINVSHKILLNLFVGFIAGTLPFFRIQGLFSSVLILIFILIIKGRIRYFVMGFGIALILWLIIIRLNGGLDSYLTNILSVPVDGLNQYTTLTYILNFCRGLIGYYLFIYWIYISLNIVTNFVSRNRNLFRNYMKLKTTKMLYFILTILVVPNIFSDYKLWIDTFDRHGSTFFLDLSLPFAIEIILLNIYKKVKHKGNYISKELFFSALGVLINIVYQFPLPDLGHKWWSSAFSAIFLVLYFSVKPKENLTNENNYLVSLLVIITICISIINIYFFTTIKYENINNRNLTLYNGIQIPYYDKESLTKFFNSKELINYLENNKIDIDYFCRDGLYYINQSGFSSKSNEALDFVNLYKKSIHDGKNYVQFYCNYESLDKDLYISKEYIIFGNEKQDIFVFNNFEEDEFSKISLIFSNRK